MNCPKCDYENTRVVQTKAEADVNYRIRSCPVCRLRFKTAEVRDVKTPVSLPATVTAEEA